MKTSIVWAALLAVGCGSGGTSHGSAVLGYSYECYGLAYELEPDVPVMLHEWYCVAAAPAGDRGSVACWQSAEDRVALESPDNATRKLDGGKCGDALQLTSRMGETCSVTIACQ